eukprot:s1177_g4.t1
MVYFFHDLFTNFGHDAAGLVAQALPFAGKLSCFHGLKVSSVASSALGRGMDAPLATQLAMPGHAEGPALAAKLLQGGGGSCGAPSSWGPALWKSLHCMVHSMPASLPPEQQHSFEAMMNSLPSALPCNSCGEHLQQHLNDDPLGTQQRSSKENPSSRAGSDDM